MFDRNENEGSYGSTLLVFLLGAAVGATVAILYAPMSGKETRAQIAEKAGNLKEKAVDLKNQIAEKASHWKEAAASKLHGVGDTMSEAVQSAKDNV